MYTIRADGSGLRPVTDYGTVEHFGGPYAISSDGRYLTYTRVGSTVELWGKQVLASDVAHAAGTIAYQIFCNLRRVPRLYSGA